MIFSIVASVLIFGYACWTLIRFVRKSKEGQCAACSLNKHCAKASCNYTPIQEEQINRSFKEHHAS
ncbi:FeoB-associated Cys-rich membrane protein [Heyndrickxia ginsengihumi]|uniref:FeoB-associated Cys-rich membrane protein n=1 Tax=Heyndrickxia ginsengihumi TaxID=363870 RepID=A0A0A6VB37_9BACI|nr:FeoB-associated Cys-rich membrane protein [Heyndrickxia ginsengihumi]KHD85470.1 hypothetical protein NG54_08785 [Heyndrickxia ginsengihumi]MBE6185647.1 FeoB-associated Cys-rich membrane protein [Bacillus sp. (in: firmicutes)]MCM3023866.1 FeoB-associated Cys-rich membrane protein [Heyndrickxia ginsengihumi]NEY20713.1 FeoB-associated Cys-rich membrane protein [Heyndrickxia ginsengihumi]